MPPRKEGGLTSNRTSRRHRKRLISSVNPSKKWAGEMWITSPINIFLVVSSLFVCHDAQNHFNRDPLIPSFHLQCQVVESSIILVEAYGGWWWWWMMDEGWWILCAKIQSLLFKQPGFHWMTLREIVVSRFNFERYLPWTAEEVFSSCHAWGNSVSGVGCEGGFLWGRWTGAERGRIGGS